MDFAIIIILLLIGAYCFLRSVFKMSHKATIFTIIASLIGAYRSVSEDGHENRGGKND